MPDRQNAPPMLREISRKAAAAFRHKKIMLSAAAAVLCGLCASGCAGIVSIPAQSGAVSRAAVWDAPYAPGTGSRTMRVVSLTPSLTETICELGGLELLVGVTDNDHYPAGVEKIPSVGDMHPNLELIAALAPDLLIYDEGLIPAGFQGRLEALGVKRLALHQNSLPEIRANMITLGEKLDLKSGAADAVERFDGRLEKISRGRQSLKKRPAVLMAIWCEPLTLCGNGSFVDSLLLLAGGRNCCADIPGEYPRVSMEEIVRRDPDMIAAACDYVPAEIEKRPDWGSLRAVKKKRFYQLPPDLICRPAPRCLEGAELLQSYCRESIQDGVR